MDGANPALEADLHERGQPPLDKWTGLGIPRRTFSPFPRANGLYGKRSILRWNHRTRVSSWAREANSCFAEINAIELRCTAAWGWSLML